MTKKPKSREGVPTRQAIANYWTSSAGIKMILEIRDVYGINVTRLLCIEHDVAHCWACNKALRGGHCKYNKPDLALERCHIIPRSLGGSNTFSNLFLMCQRCHQESPDTCDPDYFWSWFDHVEDHFQKELRELKNALDLSSIDVASVPSVEEMVSCIERAAEGLKIITHGGSIAQGTKIVLLQKALNLKAQHT